MKELSLFLEVVGFLKEILLQQAGRILLLTMPLSHLWASLASLVVTHVILNFFTSSV